MQLSHLLNIPFRKNGHWSQELGCKVQNLMLTRFFFIFRPEKNREKNLPSIQNVQSTESVPIGEKKSNP